MQGIKKVGEFCGGCYCPETMADFTSCGCPPSFNAGDCEKGLFCSRSKDHRQQIPEQKSITGDLIYSKLKLINSPYHHVAGTKLPQKANEAIRMLLVYPQTTGVCIPKGNRCIVILI